MRSVSSYNIPAPIKVETWVAGEPRSWELSGSVEPDSPELASILRDLEAQGLASQATETKRSKAGKAEPETTEEL